MRNMARRPQLETLEERSLLTAGALDTTFGGGAGFVKTDLGSTADSARTIAVEPWDSKAVLACDSSSSASGAVFTLVRYNTDGTLDTTFGQGGVVRTDFYGGGDAVNQVIFTASHQIIAVGRAYNGQGKGAGQQIGIARYNADGSLDTSFGSGGKVTVQASTAYKSNSSNASAAVVDSSGRLIVAGSYVGQNPFKAFNYANVLLRLNANGSLDTSFGSGGILVGAIASSTYDTWANLQLKPVGSGYQIDAYGVDHGKDSLAQFNSNGTRDTSFGTNGEVVLAGGGIGGGGGTILIAFEPDGGFVGVNHQGNQSPISGLFCTFGLTRYDAAGNVVFDKTIDLSPLLPSGETWGETRIKGVAVDPSGRIVVAGDMLLKGTTPTTRWDSLLVRLDAAGNFDSTFGNGGLVSTDFGPYYDGFTCLAIQPDGSILAAGQIDDGNGAVDQNGNDIVQYDVLVARYSSQ